MIVVWLSAGEGCVQVCGGDIGEDSAQHGGPSSGPGAGQVGRPRAGPRSRRCLRVSLTPSHPLPSTPSLPHTLSPLPHPLSSTPSLPHTPSHLPYGTSSGRPHTISPAHPHTLTPHSLTPHPITSHHTPPQVLQHLCDVGEPREPSDSVSVSVLRV